MTTARANYTARVAAGTAAQTVPLAPILRLLWLVIAIVSLIGRVAFGQAIQTAQEPARAETTRIELLPALSIPAVRTITIGDIARVSDGDAAVIQALPLDSTLTKPLAATGRVTIELSQLRAALQNAKGINAGRLALSGGSCIVTLDVPKSELVATPKTATTSADRIVDGESTGDTVRAAITRQLIDRFGVPPESLQLTFDTAHDAILNAPLTGRTAVIRPTAAGDRIPFAVRVYENESVVVQGTVRVGVLLHREVAIARANLTRNVPIMDDDLTVEMQWVAPSVNAAAITDIIGSVPRSGIRTGDIISVKQIQPAILVKRGDLVAVDSFKGGIVVRANLRAKTDGRMGEDVILQAPSGKGEVTARVTGPSTAIIGADHPHSDTIPQPSAGSLRQIP